MTLDLVYDDSDSEVYVCNRMTCSGVDAFGRKIARIKADNTLVKVIGGLMYKVNQAVCVDIDDEMMTMPHGLNGILGITFPSEMSIESGLSRLSR